MNKKNMNFIQINSRTIINHYNGNVNVNVNGNGKVNVNVNGNDRNAISFFYTILSLLKK